MMEYIGEHTWAGQLGHVLAILSFVGALLATTSFFLGERGKTLEWIKLGRLGFWLHSLAVLGIVAMLFTMLTGETPPVRGAPPLSLLRADCPQALAAVLESARPGQPDPPLSSLPPPQPPSAPPPPPPEAYEPPGKHPPPPRPLPPSPPPRPPTPPPPPQPHHTPHPPRHPPQRTLRRHRKPRPPQPSS